MPTSHFIAITGIKHCYGERPFEIGRIVRLVKEPDNVHDAETIRVEPPFVGGAVCAANSAKRAHMGTWSTGRRHSFLGEEAYARVSFVRGGNVAPQFLKPEKAKNADGDKSLRPRGAKHRRTVGMSRCPALFVGD